MTSMDIALTGASYNIDPEQGLLIDPDGQALAVADADDTTLAAFDEALREQREFIKQATAVVEDELKTRIRHTGARSLKVGPHLIELERKREWDPTLTWEALQVLVRAGLLSDDEADKAMPNVTARKPDGRKLNSILTDVVGKDPEAAQALARARSERSYIKLARTAVDAEVAE